MNRQQPRSTRLLDFLARGILALAVWAGAPHSVARADDAGANSADGGEGDPDIQALNEESQRIEALLRGKLDIAVDPATLFDVDLDDPAAVRVDAARLGAIVAAANETSSVTKGRKPRVFRTGVARGSSPQDAGEPRADPALFAARIALDRTRLEFYDLRDARRRTLLATHAERQQAARQKGPALGESERRARNAEAQREQALKEAESARTEAEKTVAEEYAKVLEVTQKQADFESKLALARENLKARAEEALALDRRVRETLDGAHSDPSVADSLYDDLRASLRGARKELARALSATSPDGRAVSAPPDDPLGRLPVGVNHAAYDHAREAAIIAAGRLSESAIALNEQRIDQLGEEIHVQNESRLSLLPLLTSSKRVAITGFGPSGFDQASAEIRQVVLIVRYHLHKARDWLIATSSRDKGGSSVSAAFLIAKWLFASVVFIWWRRRAVVVLSVWRSRVQEQERRARMVEPSPLYKALGLVLQVRKPLEWLVFGWALLALAPEDAAQLLEVNLGRTIFIWMLGGALGVSTIDALSGREHDEGETGNSSQIAQLRLRSLRLVGRTIVAFGLTLSLTARLVGQGTIYSWVFSTCWFAAAPVFLVIVRWWREEIYRRIGRMRKKRAFELWIERNQTGSASFFTAAVGGAYLFGVGALRATRTWASRFDVTRRALAYLFLRDLDRLAEENTAVAFEALPEAVFAALGPDVPSAELVITRSIEDTENLLERMAESGGVIAIVGERGAGKTTLLHRIEEANAGMVSIECPFGGFETLERALNTRLDLRGERTLSDAVDTLKSSHHTGLLIDDAHRLIHPVMGGLAAFDRLLETARSHASNFTWVFAMDEVVWPFFRQARGVRPLFDEVILLEGWPEEHIARLIEARCRQADVKPSFRHVLPKMPLDADETDIGEATRRTTGNYHRLLWDYSAGCPGVALHMWRQSLGVDATGQSYVKPFRPPDPADLERLPDPAVFVLRTIIQLEEATRDEIAAATMLRLSPIEDALRYCTARGYLERVGDRYHMSWAWFRAVTRFLQRRHLLGRVLD